jgi:hypothetical protein
MQVREVDRWRCEKCGRVCVAAGRKDRRLTRIGIVAGAACPWECGLRINRGFRFVKSTDVTLYTVDAWDQVAFDGSATISETPSVSDDAARSWPGESAFDGAKGRGKESRVFGKGSSSDYHDAWGLGRKPLIQHLLAIVGVIGPRVAVSRES